MGHNIEILKELKILMHPMDEDAFRKMIPILQKHNYHISILQQKENIF